MAQSAKRRVTHRATEPETADPLAALYAQRRDALLEAIAKSAEKLLRTDDVRQSVSAVIEEIGHATAVDRVHLLAVDPAGATTIGRIRDHTFWSAAGIATSETFRNAKGTTAKGNGILSWLPRLARGEIITGHTRGFEGSVRRFFESGDVKSTACVPVFVGGRWWGFIGFDDCRNERHWSQAEIDTLKIFGELIGAAIARARQVRALADANRIIENSPTILYRLLAQQPYSLTYISPNISRYGYDAKRLLAAPANWKRLIAAEDRAGLLANIKAISEGQSEQIRSEFRIRTREGALVWFESLGTALRDNNGRVIAVEGILNDVTERKLSGDEISHLARTDSLTGLPNRTAFLERLNLEFARAKRYGSAFAVHFLDLDHFKDVNDTLGHPIGDALLTAVAGRVQDCLRETDLVARFGGDEFAVLQDEVAEAETAEVLAKKIGAALAEPYFIEGNIIHTTASIGVVPYSIHSDSPENMMTRADLALYRAKNEGRNQYRFHAAELDRQVHERVTISEDLHLAIERSELELHYQPQVELGSGQIVGVEALVRWNHPTRGLLLPKAFIPIAETTGAINAIGQWVIEQACRQIENWRAQEIAPAVVSVNLSMAQFKLASVIDQVVAEALARHKLSAAQLELEMTEATLMEISQRHVDVFERLRRLGVRLAIDDFGTGYSSLDHLRSCRVARLKIDQRFIAGVTIRSEDATIVRAAIGLAHELGMQAVAEGVETAAQRAFLLESRCDLGQGLLLGRPMPVPRMTELLAKGETITST